ncbi:hypothetical protein F6Y05_00265 [Bacillus megaterium]|nr:hypothetical protein [Priestia megaterium]
MQEESKLEVQDLYRLGSISGFDNKGHPFIGAKTLLTWSDFMMIMCTIGGQMKRIMW